MSNECKFMPEIIYSPQIERETVTPTFHSGQIVQSKPLSVWRLGDGRVVGVYFQRTRHVFFFQFYVFTKNILVTHFHHNLLVSMFSVKTLTDVSPRREEHKSYSICLFCPWCLSPSHMFPSAFIRLIFRVAIYVTFCHQNLSDFFLIKIRDTINWGAHYSALCHW